MNVAMIQGRPTREPELKDTTSGRVMCKMRVAVERPYMGKNAPKKTDYFDVISFGDLGRSIYRNVGKGALLTILGRIEQNEYISRSGDKRESYSIVANKVTIHEWLKKNSPIEQLSAGDDPLIPQEITASLMKCVDLEDEDMPIDFYGI